jgi:two-component system cell cycle response regulator
MDDFEICRRISADPASAHIPVVILTGLLDDTSRVKGLEVGADDYLTKPFHIIELMASIRSLLQ